jgi:hypothetical protein
MGANGNIYQQQQQPQLEEPSWSQLLYYNITVYLGVAYNCVTGRLTSSLLDARLADYGHGNTATLS